MQNDHNGIIPVQKSLLNPHRHTCYKGPAECSRAASPLAQQAEEWASERVRYFMQNDHNGIIPVQKSLFRWASRSRTGRSTSRRSWWCSRNCRRHTRHCRASSPSCDSYRRLAPVTLFSFSLRSKPKKHKSIS